MHVQGNSPRSAALRPALLLAPALVLGLLGVLCPQRAISSTVQDAAARGAALSQGTLLFLGTLLVLAAALAAAVALLRRGSPPDAPLAARLRAGLAACGGARTAAALCAVLALAAGLRAPGLGSGLWFDEVVTLVEYVRLPTPELLTTYTALNNHLLYSLLAQGSIALLGESAWALRLPAAVLGVASIGALFVLGVQLAGRREALLAALLLAVSYHHVWFSQNARGYTGILLLGLVGTSLFVEGMRRRSRGLWVAYALVLALALYTHLSAGFLFAGHGIVYVFLYGRARLRPGGGDLPGAVEAWPLLGFALGGLVALQLYAVLLPQMFEAFALQSGVESANVKVSEWRSPLWTALELVRGLDLGFGSLAGALAVGLLGAAGGLSYLRRSPLAAWLMVLPAPVALAAVLALSFHFWPRYFFALIGFAALLLVRGAFVIAGFALRGRARPAAVPGGVLLAGLVISASAHSLAPNYRLPKQDFAGARDFVEARRARGEPVVTVGLATLPYRRYYAPDWSAAATAAELEAFQAGAARTWVVYAFPAYLEAASPDLLERIDRDFEVLGEFRGTLGGGTIYVCRTREPGAAARPAPADAGAAALDTRPAPPGPSPESNAVSRRSDHLAGPAGNPPLVGSDA